MQVPVLLPYRASTALSLTGKALSFDITGTRGVISLSVCLLTAPMLLEMGSEVAEKLVASRFT